ncbi:MAG: T9SS type A sorting domain-containing protein [Bacteroidia bacterium]
MKKINLLYLALLLVPQIGSSQCTTSTGGGNTNATSCVCPPGGGTNCDLIPDISIAQLPLNQSSNYTEYPQVCNPPCDGNDGRLRIGVSTPIIGYGPLETRGTSWYVCGTDTVNAGTVGNIPATCPISGLPPKQLINQRIYHKNGNTMSYTDRAAGSMTYHPSHGHQHVDDWGIYTLRTNNGDPNPLNWPIIGTGSKLGFCLIDLGNCNSSPGYCKDSLGNTLNSSNISNYGLGGGNYGCNNTVQGITNGYMDTYSQGLDGMWINLPAGLCNGNYWVVVQIDPYNYFLETRETNNVVAVPITLTQQSPSGTATITANKNPNICISDNIILTANNGSNYLWNTGATTQSITVNTAGNYTVTVTNVCGTATSSPFAVTTYGPNPPSTTGASVCNSGSGTLQATGSGTINWYASSSGGSSLGTGTSFLTPVVNNTTTYYADATQGTPPQTLFCPPAANTIGGGGQYNGSQYLTFNVSAACTLVSAKIYADVAGTFTVQLQNSSGSTINSISKTVPAGESRVTLNFPLSVGNAYRLTRSGSFSLYRNNGGVAYPYNVTNFVSITGSSAGAAFYYFYYDWEILTAASTCTSLRSPATLTVNPNPNATITPNGPTTFCAGTNMTLSVAPLAGATYKWYRNNILLSGATSSSYTTTADGSFYAVVTSSTGCVSTSTPVVLIKNPNPTASITAGGPLSFCVGGSVTLTANSGTGYTHQWKKNGNNIAGATNISYTADLTGNYRVVVTNSFGCSATSGVVAVTKNSNPVATISPAGTITFCAGQSALLTANSGSGYTYVWKKDGVIIAGATNISYTATTAGKYRVVVTNSFGCTKTSSADTVVVPCREDGSIIENVFAASVHPNPSSDAFLFEVHHEMDKNIFIIIYDAAGRMVNFNLEQKSELQYQVSGLKTGLYSAFITDGNNTKVLKLIRTQ